jgi:hypothetical protein
LKSSVEVSASSANPRSGFENRWVPRWAASKSPSAPERAQIWMAPVVVGGCGVGG